MKRAVVVILTVAALAAAPASIAPAHAADFSGFTTSATATPLKIEVYEPAIPVPAEPQMELDFSYTRVDGTSGPVGDARASAMWPGDSVGEGWKTIGDTLGLPEALTKDGYPMQVNAQSPGDAGQAAQEPLPGMVARVSANDKMAIAKAGYSAGGDVAEGQPDGESQPTDPLKALSGGDLGALGNALTGSTGGSADGPPSNPLGALSALVDPSGMSSISTTDYSGDVVVAKATSRLGALTLLGGLVKLTGIEVVARTTSNLAAGAKTTSKVTFGGMTIAGQPYTMTSEGIEGGGQKAPIPGLPADATKALKALGISFDLPAPRVIKDGAHGGVAVEGLRVTVDSQVLRSKLPALPLGDLINKMPDQAGQLKSLLLALTEAHPKFVVSLGAVTTDATTVPGIDLGAASSPPAGATTGAGTAGTPGSAGTPATAGSPGEVAPAAAGAPANTELKQVSAVPGLPPLGTVPGMLALLGLLLAAGAGWYLRRVGGLLFGAGGTCTHGLKAGVPDLRKA